MKTATAPADPPHDSLGVLIGLVRTEMVRAIEASLAKRGLDLSFTQFLILKRLQAIGPRSASELARAVELDAGAMTRQLDQLEGKGFLRRVPHEQDRRALRIELTEAGAVLCREILACNEVVMEVAQQALDEDERARLMDYLERVLHALRNRH
jgi:DNA-binding MarR family transcriptional regulator